MLGDFDQTNPAITALVDTDTNPAIYARNNKGSTQPCYVAAGGDGTVKAAINNDGSATFAGNVYIGDDASISGNDGSAKTLRGDIQLLADGSADVCWQSAIEGT